MQTRLKGWVGFYTVPIVIFLVSRLILLLTLLLAKKYGVIDEWGLNHWDGVHYSAIANTGYTFGGHDAESNTIAFFPLYPLLVKAMTSVLGLSSLNSGMLISLLLGTASAGGLYYYTILLKDKVVAQVAVLLFSFYPLSIFLSAVYAESLLFFLIILALIFLHQKWLVWASVAISLALVTKIIGFLLLPILLYELWKDQNRTWIKTILCAGIILLPFCLFMTYQYHLFGTPLAFLQAQTLGWHKTLAPPWEGVVFLIITFSNQITVWQVELVIFLLGLVTLTFSLRTLHPHLLWFSSMLLLTCVSTNIPYSIGRFLISFLPFYIYWGEILSKRSLIQQLILLFSCSWMIISIIAFVLNKDVY